jgi:Na+:H+ antiporter, NhaA family
MAVKQIFRDFVSSEQSGGLTLLACTAVSMTLANVSSGYFNFWHLLVFDHSLTHWINDGLMTIFFLLVGLELKRELLIGELSSLQKASLPAIAALGGMLFPAIIYFIFNSKGEAARGVGVPTATDIAFALGILSLLGNRVPITLKIFLTALAVIDDLGAILLIALFYTSSISWIDLGIASGLFIVLIFLNHKRVYSVVPYLIVGIVMWYFMLHSGIHATLTGVLVAFIIPFERNKENATANLLQKKLHLPVASIILPLFALANTAMILNGDLGNYLSSPISLGIMAGLVIGKPFGIFLFSYGAIRLQISSMPSKVKWIHLFGAGLLGGIGFTMSIFISILAFTDPTIVDQSKISVLLASLASAIAGLFWLKKTL